MKTYFTIKSNRAEQAKGGWVLPAQARKGGGSMVVESEPRPLLRVQGAKVALAKVSEASRKVRVQPHFVSSTEKLKMGRGKRAGHWRAVVFSKLHIDDGTGDWSGGTSIPHYDRIFYDEIRTGYDYPTFYDIKWGDGWDTDGDFEIDPGENINNGYFNPERKGIFHYCLFVHNLYLFRNGDWVTDRPGTSNGPNNNENNNWGGDDFIVTSKVTDDNQWKAFMHELGHNFGLAHPDNDGSQNSNPNCFHASHSNLKTSIMHSTSWKGTDYFDDEWDFIHLEYVDDSGHYNN